MDTPMYCGECGDYGIGQIMDTPTCSNIRGQNSTRACCKSVVKSLACGAGVSAAECIPSCKDSTPPCILSGQQAEEARLLTPPGRQARDDCGSALKQWREKAEAARVAAGMATAGPSTTTVTPVVDPLDPTRNGGAVTIPAPTPMPTTQ